MTSFARFLDILDKLIKNNQAEDADVVIRDRLGNDRIVETIELEFDGYDGNEIWLRLKMGDCINDD